MVESNKMKLSFTNLDIIIVIIIIIIIFIIINIFVITENFCQFISNCSRPS